jgi:hypothetical protein
MPTLFTVERFLHDNIWSRAVPVKNLLQTSQGGKKTCFLSFFYRVFGRFSLHEELKTP